MPAENVTCVAQWLGHDGPIPPSPSDNNLSDGTTMAASGDSLPDFVIVCLAMLMFVAAGYVLSKRFRRS